MYVTRSTGPAHVELFVLVGLNQRINELPPSHSNQAYVGDPTFANLVYNNEDVSKTAFLKSSPMRIVDVISVADYQVEKPRDDGFLIQKPQKENWDGTLDWERYGSLFGILNRIRKNTAAGDTRAREHDVSHISFVGDVEDIQLDKYYHLNGFNWSYNYDGEPGNPLFSPDIDIAVGRYRAVGFTDQGNLVFEAGSKAYHYTNTLDPQFDYYDFVQRRCQFIADSGGEISVSPNESSIWKYYSRNVVNKSHKGHNFYHIDVEYELEIEGHGYYLGEYFVRSFYQVHLDFSVAFQAAPRGTNSISEWNYVHPETVKLTDNCSVSVTDSYEWRAEYGPRYFLPWPDLSAGLHVTLQDNGLDPNYVVSAFSPPAQSSSPVTNLTAYKHDGNVHNDERILRMERSLGLNMPSIRPSCFYSASNALHKSIDVLSSNNIENLSQLSGLLALIPDLPGFGKLIAKVTRKDPSAIVDFVDLVTDAILKLRFGQAPTLDDAGEILRTDFKKEIGHLLQLHSYTTYGKFDHEFTVNENPLGGLGVTTLVTRSKVRLTFDMSNLMATYLVGNSVGLLPTLSRLWAVIPFSFVVDWFTNMDKRLQAVDDQLLWMAITTQFCVHSYALTYYPTPEELEPYGLKQFEGGEPFGIRFYKRELSLVMPSLRDSKYDFLAPDSNPDPIVVGSLVWQKI